jgi:hypothetical protein
MQTRYSLTCLNPDCARPIWLPLPIPLGRSANQIPWSKDGKPHNFVCLRCNHVYEYTVEAVQHHLVESQDQDEDVDCLFELVLECGEHNCVYHVHILKPAHSIQAQTYSPPYWLNKPIWGTFWCSRGHYVQTAEQRSTAYRAARVFPDWVAWPEVN